MSLDNISNEIKENLLKIKFLKNQKIDLENSNIINHKVMIEAIDSKILDLRVNTCMKLEDIEN